MHLKSLWPGASWLYFATGSLGQEAPHACLAPTWSVQPFKTVVEALLLLHILLSSDFWPLLLQVYCTCMHAQSLQSCLTLWNTMDCSPPSSSVHGISQVRILEWATVPSSRDPASPTLQADSLLLSHWSTHKPILLTKSSVNKSSDFVQSLTKQFICLQASAWCFVCLNRSLQHKPWTRISICGGQNNGSTKMFKP